MTVVRLRPVTGPAVYATWLFPSDVQRGNEEAPVQVAFEANFL